jgi:hypothetical protein
MWVSHTTARNKIFPQKTLFLCSSKRFKKLSQMKFDFFMIHHLDHGIATTLPGIEHDTTEIWTTAGIFPFFSLFSAGIELDIHLSTRCLINWAIGTLRTKTSHCDHANPAEAEYTRCFCTSPCCTNFKTPHCRKRKSGLRYLKLDLQ